MCANRRNLIDLVPLDIISVQHVNKKLLRLARDDALWRDQCFEDSSFLKNLRRCRHLLSSEEDDSPGLRRLAQALASGNGADDSRLVSRTLEDQDARTQAKERVRIVANWDPSFPNESVSWYNEYIARHAPISTSWLQQPRNLNLKEGGYVEVRGFALYQPMRSSASTLVVGPLEDGSVCIWDIDRMSSRRGRILARSSPGLLSVDEEQGNVPNKRSKMLNTAVTECVSVDSDIHRAYFAVQSGKKE